MKKLLLPILHFTCYTLVAQPQQPAANKSKLIVGIVIDQMRNDYLYRFWDRYSDGGFKRLVSDGYYFKNAHFNYVPTYTGPGHSSIYTGATPRQHGIIANDWFEKTTGRSIYCVEDNSVRTVGSENGAGRMSPVHQLSSTIGDELKMNTNQLAKVFSVALKDRSAILPAGHSANAAYWYDDESGNFISSSWYCNTLPDWLNQFNAQKPVRSYLSKGWNTLYPLNTYTSSTVDSTNYEGTVLKEKPIFPYNFSGFIDKNKWGIIKATPYGNSLTKDLALACLINEQLGKDEIPDLLSISFSSSDIVAHSYGIRAVEIEDLYLRLDRDIEQILQILDREVGKGNYSVFLTADHGGADVPRHLMDHKIPSGYINEKAIEKQIKHFFKTFYEDTLLFQNMSNEQVFLDMKRLTEKKLSADEVEEQLCRFLNGVEGISEAYPSSLLKYGSFEKTDHRTLAQNGYNFKLSGNVCLFYLPGWMAHSQKGTTHGSGYNYDTHVPLIFFGSGVRKGETSAYVSIPQIAPSVCELLHINQPNSCNSEPLNDHFKK